jgi:transcriptional regulator with XRE-family HTH domain
MGSVPRSLSFILYSHLVWPTKLFVMNRLLYVARKAKGLTGAQLAKVLQIEESDYIELEHSIADVTAKQALLLAKLYDIDAEQFIYTEGRKERLVKYAMDEIKRYDKEALLANIPPQYYQNIVRLGNDLLSLHADYSHALYRHYELENDNEALKKINAELKKTIKDCA